MFLKHHQIAEVFTRKHSWENLIGPKWLGYVTVSTVFISGFVTGWSFTRGEFTTAVLILVLGMINIAALVRHLWWVFELIDETASSKTLREYLSEKEGEFEYQEVGS